ncbi:MAG: glycosyltransferase family 39 protein [Steroidobacteraceae bacterium]
MSNEVRTSSPFGEARSRLLLAIAAVAVIVGVFARFKGLNIWPLGPDEYYFAQSVENILRTGLPAYPCGGYYERGIVLQYLAAGLQLLGLSAELAPRFLAAVSSLVALPAVYLLGRRVHGAQVGLLAVALVALSVWEVEMARFGRMYAPFQAVFLWHLVYFLRYTVDRQTQALRGMILLSFLGVLVWEGGVLQIALNLLPPFINHDRGRLSRAQWRYLVLMGLLMLPIYLYWSSTSGLRWASEIPPLPDDFVGVVTKARSSVATFPPPLWRALTDHPVVSALGLVPLLLAGWALPWIWSFRRRWLAALGLLATLMAALTHQFLLVGAAVALLLLTGLVNWRELFDRSAWRFHASILSAAVFWILVGVFTDSWRHGPSDSMSTAIAAFVHELFGFPNILELVARPWARAVAGLGLSIVLLLSVSAARAIFNNDASLIDRVLLIVVVIMLLLVGIAGAPRFETRYTFFLYPLFLVIGITVLVRAVEQFARWRPQAPLIGTAVVLGWFAMMEDFQPGHLLRIDSAEITLRRDMSPARRSHYYSRGNIRATADWLQANAIGSTDLVVSGPGVTALDFYYPEIDFVYVDPSDQRLQAWSCQRGTVERWSNLPLVYKMAALETQIAAHPRSYIVIAAREAEEYAARLGKFNPRIVQVSEFASPVILLIERADSDRIRALPVQTFPTQ